MAAVGTDSGYRAAYQIFAEGDLTGGITHMDMAAFNAASVEALRAQYDVVIITWGTSSRLNASWQTRLLPFLALGGGIIFEDTLNYADLLPAVTARVRFPFEGTFNVSAVPGLTDGVSNHFVNNHGAFASWDARLAPFLHLDGIPIGLYGGFPGGGRAVVTGADQHFHGRKSSGLQAERNQYVLLRNEICWAAGCVNQTPVARVSGPQTVECSGQLTEVLLDGSGSFDTDRDVLTYAWSGPFAPVQATEPLSRVYVPLGEHHVTLSVTDAFGATGTTGTQVVVVDTTAPSISVPEHVADIWSPDHKMYLVASGIAANDACDPAPSFEVSVSSSEAEDGAGDGSTQPDWQVVRREDGNFDVWLRAERSGVGEGRTYTVAVTARDVSGHAAGVETRVTIGHNQ